MRFFILALTNFVPTYFMQKTYSTWLGGTQHHIHLKISSDKDFSIYCLTSCGCQNVQSIPWLHKFLQLTFSDISTVMYKKTVADESDIAYDRPFDELTWPNDIILPSQSAVPPS